MPRIATARLDTPLGPLLAAAVDEGVCLLSFADPGRPEADLAALRPWLGADAAPAPHPHLDALRDQLTAYFAGRATDFTVPVLLLGTDFQVAVWQQLRRIPYGQTRSYEDMAHAVAAPRSSRAVGQANGQNRVPIVVPCHRVVNKGGRLGGYGGGLDRKKFLLDLEQAKPRTTV